MLISDTKDIRAPRIALIAIPESMTELFLPDGSCSVNAAIAASTSATSTGGYTTSYIYAGTQSSSATESGAKASVNYGSKASNTPLASANSAINLKT